MTSTIDRRITALRHEISLVGPVAAARIVAEGGLLVDIRPAAQRRRFGAFPDAVIIERNVLEWRLDPTGDDRLPAITGDDLPIVIACQEGYASTLAVASLEQLGLRRVHDLAGGFVAWRDAGLSIRAPWPHGDTRGPTDVVRELEVVRA